MTTVHKTVVNNKLNSFFYECLISLLQITTFMMISNIRFDIFSESHLCDKCFKLATGKKNEKMELIRLKKVRIMYDVSRHVLYRQFSVDRVFTIYWK